MGVVQYWHLILVSAGFLGSLVGIYNSMNEKVIRLEEKVKFQHDNHTRTDELIKEMKGTIDKIWERLEKKEDKK